MGLVERRKRRELELKTDSVGWTRLMVKVKVQQLLLEEHDPKAPEEATEVVCF